MAVFGKGTKLSRETAPGSGVYQDIVGVKQISGPTFAAEELDVTDQDSPGDVREFIRGLIDAGQLSVTLNFDPNEATHQLIYNDMLDGQRRNWRVAFAGAAGAPPVPRLDMVAFVQGNPWELPPDNVYGSTLTLRVAEAPTLVTV